MLQARLGRLAEDIGRLERKTDFILQALHLDYQDEPDSSMPEVSALIKQGKRIEAIKAYRQRTGASAEEAALAIDKLGRVEKHQQ
jgi:ribosomal protein L7/L12